MPRSIRKPYQRQQDLSPTTRKRPSPILRRDSRTRCLPRSGLPVSAEAPMDARLIRLIGMEYEPLPRFPTGRRGGLSNPRAYVLGPSHDGSTVLVPACEPSIVGRVGFCRIVSDVRRPGIKRTTRPTIPHGPRPYSATIRERYKLGTGPSPEVATALSRERPSKPRGSYGSFFVGHFVSRRQKTQAPASPYLLAIPGGHATSRENGPPRMEGRHRSSLKSWYLYEGNVVHYKAIQ